MDCRSATLRVTNIPFSALAKELFDYFEAAVGPVFACEIATARRNWKSRGHGRIQFESIADARRADRMASEGLLPNFQRARLALARAHDDIVPRAVDERNRVRAVMLYAGVLSAPKDMHVFASWERARVEIMGERNKLLLFVEHDGEMYKLEWMFDDILAALGCLLGGEDSKAILLRFRYAPRIYVRISESTVKSRHEDNRYCAFREDSHFRWVRTTDFTPNHAIGNSWYFCLQLEDGFSYLEILKALPLSGELEELALSMHQNFSPSSKLVPMINVCSGSLPFEVLFQLNSLVHLQKLSCRQVRDDLFDILCELPLHTAVNVLEKMHRLNSTCYDPVHFIKRQLVNMKMHRNLTSCNNSVREQGFMSIHRILITPSKVYCLGPELQSSNYVVKHFSAHASDFVRVHFVEENWAKLPADAISVKLEQGLFSKPHRTTIYDRISSLLKDGICIGSKKFEFLAFSASQLRGSSVWMFASNDSVSAENIREWMGHFRNIHSVSKCAARMGQLFSSSKQTFNVSVFDVKIIPDIEITTDDGKKYCFSDGIGRIGSSFAGEVAQKCGLTHIPSVFQIRYGGYKGVVAIDKNSFHKLSLRKSMLKFESTNRMLCVTNYSEYQPCYLNREIISLLSTLGIGDEIFMSLQNDQVTDLDQMLTNRDVALKVLDRATVGENRILKKMLMRGYKPNSEPYLSMMLSAHRNYQLADIKSKCRILVPRGRVLVGCLDEIAKLDYGQVFIKVTLTKNEIEDRHQKSLQKTDKGTAILIGSVLVTKNPCLHPGDVRVLQAVYDDDLDGMGLVDCIVFPQKGERPHPNECSGGDLDGDLYFICWDEKLIPSETDAPMDYTAPRPRLTDHDVTLEEIQKFFIDYMINDSLGIISNAHLVHADRECEKARSSKCLELAHLHSMAVDFAKTGVPAEMPRILKPREYPDFMERSDRPMYTSNGVLGKLYRAFSTYANKQTIFSQSPLQNVYDEDLEVEGFEAFLLDAEEYYSQYSEKLSSLMNYFGAKDEEEMLTGNLHSVYIYLQRDKNRHREMKDHILIAVRSLHREVGEWFKSSCSEDDSRKMAAAWYHVTYHPSHEREVRFLSFPWIVSDVLLSIKETKNQANQKSK